MKNKTELKKIKSINIVSSNRVINNIHDLGYYENNEVENIKIIPRSKINIKVIIKQK